MTVLDPFGAVIPSWQEWNKGGAISKFYDDLKEEWTERRMKNILSSVLFVCFLEAHLHGSGHVGVCEVAVEFLLLELFYSISTISTISTILFCSLSLRLLGWSLGEPAWRLGVMFSHSSSAPSLRCTSLPLAVAYLSSPFKNLGRFVSSKGSILDRDSAQ